MAWVDHGPVLFLTNASDPLEQVIRSRRRPSETATWAKVIREPFKGKTTKDLEIPLMIDQYNHFMNGVDRAGQLRALGSPPRANRAWKALFNDSIQLMLCNCFLLAKHSPGWLSKELQEPTAFKRAVFNALISGGGSWGVGLSSSRVTWGMHGHSGL